MKHSFSFDSPFSKVFNTNYAPTDQELAQLQTICGDITQRQKQQEYLDSHRMLPSPQIIQYSRHPRISGHNDFEAFPIIGYELQFGLIVLSVALGLGEICTGFRNGIWIRKGFEYAGIKGGLVRRSG